MRRREAHGAFLAFLAVSALLVLASGWWLYTRVQETTEFRNRCHDRGGVMLEGAEPGLYSRPAFCAKMPEEIEI